MIIWTLLLLVLAYLLGSFPTGYVLAKRLKGVDLRKVGSGSTGSTNASRVLGIKWALAVVAVDIFKAVLAVHLAYLIVCPGFMIPLFKMVLGLVCIVGHNWSVFLGFKGGKGVAPSLGVLMGIAPQATFMALLLWVSVVALTRIVSAASITAAVSLPLLVVVYDGSLLEIGFALLLSALVLLRHRDNMKRLLKGEEKKITWQ